MKRMWEIEVDEDTYYALLFGGLLGVVLEERRIESGDILLFCCEKNSTRCEVTVVYTYLFGVDLKAEQRYVQFKRG